MRRIPAVILSMLLAVAPASAGSLRFQGVGTDGADRVEVRAHDPGRPAHVDDTDFTVELWIRGLAAGNVADGVSCGSGPGWDVSLSAGRVAFGVTNGASDPEARCGTTPILDGDWHHVALQRRRSDGWIWIWVDGVLDAQGQGPKGSLSGDPALAGAGKDPFLVLGAGTRGAAAGFPSFGGWMDEIRISSTLRYLAPFVPAAAPFAPDESTVALYHLDEGSGDVVGDASGADGGPGDGVRRFGGTPVPGPEWSADTPFAVTDAPLPALPDGAAFEAYPNPGLGQTVLFARFPDPRSGPASVTIRDVGGRRAATLPAQLDGGSALIVWDGRTEEGEPAPAGVYFARLEQGGVLLSTRFVRR
jgi:hypothetical protein